MLIYDPKCNLMLDQLTRNYVYFSKEKLIEIFKQIVTQG